MTDTFDYTDLLARLDNTTAILASSSREQRAVLDKLSTAASLIRAAIPKPEPDAKAKALEALERLMSEDQFGDVDADECAALIRAALETGGER